MIGSIIIALIYLCALVLVVYVAFWVIRKLGLEIPDRVETIIWVIVALLALLWLLVPLLPGRLP